MKNRQIVFIAGMAGIALYLIYKSRDKIQGEDPSFREGYIAGFLTPGPFTIIAVAGGVYWFTST